METSNPSRETIITRQPQIVEVSYARLDLGQGDSTVVLQQLASCITVQLMPEGQSIPFIPFDSYEGARNDNKLFLHGPSGSGKSRGIYEIIKGIMGVLKSIYVINPRNALGIISGRAELKELSSKFIRQDAVVWDNFPDDTAYNTYTALLAALLSILQYFYQ